MNIVYVRADVEQDRTAGVYYEALTQGRSNGVPLTLVGTKIFMGYDLNGITAAVKELDQSTAAEPMQTTSVPAGKCQASRAMC